MLESELIFGIVCLCRGSRCEAFLRAPQHIIQTPFRMCGEDLRDGLEVFEHLGHRGRVQKPRVVFSGPLNPPPRLVQEQTELVFAFGDVRFLSANSTAFGACESVSSVNSKRN